MASPLVWKSLDNFATLFHYCWPCPFHWDKANGRFTSTRSPILLIPWTIVVFQMTPILSVFCTSIILLTIYGTISPPLTSLFMCSIINTLLFLSISIELVWYLHNEPTKVCFGYLIQIVKREPKREQTKKIDPIGIFLNITVAMFAVYPYFLIPFLLYFEFDPTFMFAKYVLSLTLNTSLDQILFNTVRLLQFLVALQICRLFPLLVCTLMFGVLIILDTVKTLDMWVVLIKFSQNKAAAQIRRYIELTLVMQVCAGFSDASIAILMGLGLILCVLFNFVTLKLYNIIPMPLYLYFPSVAIIIPFIIDTLLPLGIRVNEKTARLKTKWGKQLDLCSDRKYLQRRLRAIKPLRFDCRVAGYNLLQLVKPTKAWFYMQIMNYTISALLFKTNPS
ncbi:hypothetical protein Fcan01_28090 [Folsomia candida]|uniref:Uncharacterized protein n=1 Tax=Folsomia candida TaxID=158441 RepID=A0A226CXJ1_FOLCA|nr:hypothetical protein Fcan01_28090 [Folsomia candida]